MVSEQTDIMTVSDFRNLDGEKKNNLQKTEGPLCQTLKPTKNTSWLEVKVLVQQLW